MDTLRNYGIPVIGIIAFGIALLGTVSYLESQGVATVWAIIVSTTILFTLFYTVGSHLTESPEYHDYMR